MNAPLSSGGKDVHLWFTDSREVGGPIAIGAGEALLSEEEASRYQGMRSSERKHTFLVARVLLRTVLSLYAEVAPGAWTVVINDHGRPSIDPRQNPLDLRFNFSHSDGFIVLALARGVDIGVDVENTTLPRQTHVLADRFFSASEAEAVRNCSEKEQRLRFFDYWTLKESYIKGRGMGLAIPLSQFSFDLDTTSGIGLTFDASVDDDPAAWHFSQHQPTPSHRVALAVRCGRDNPPEFEARRGIPLLGFEWTDSAVIRTSAGLPAS